MATVIIGEWLPLSASGSHVPMINSGQCRRVDETRSAIAGELTVQQRLTVSSRLAVV